MGVLGEELMLITDATSSVLCLNHSDKFKMLLATHKTELGLAVASVASKHQRLQSFCLCRLNLSEFIVRIPLTCTAKSIAQMWGM